MATSRGHGGGVKDTSMTVGIISQKMWACGGRLSCDALGLATSVFCLWLLGSGLVRAVFHGHLRVHHKALLRLQAAEMLANVTA